MLAEPADRPHGAAQVSAQEGAAQRGQPAGAGHAQPSPPGHGEGPTGVMCRRLPHRPCAMAAVCDAPPWPTTDGGIVCHAKQGLHTSWIVHTHVCQHGCSSPGHTRGLAVVGSHFGWTSARAFLCPRHPQECTSADAKNGPLSAARRTGRSHRASPTGRTRRAIPSRWTSGWRRTVAGCRRCRSTTPSPSWRRACTSPRARPGRASRCARR